MQPFIPPAVTSYDPFIALAWGAMVAAVPVFFLIIYAFTKRKKSFVVALAATGLAFAIGANLISPLDTVRQTQANRDAVVSEWLNEQYPQYGGASALLPYFNSGERFNAVADNGKYTPMYFSFSQESGYRLVRGSGASLTNVVPMTERVDATGQKERDAQPAS